MLFTRVPIPTYSSENIRVMPETLKLRQGDAGFGAEHQYFNDSQVEARG